MACFSLNNFQVIFKSYSYPFKSFCTIFNQTVLKNIVEEEAVVSAVVLFKVKCNLDPLEKYFCIPPTPTSFYRTQDFKKVISTPDGFFLKFVVGFPCLCLAKQCVHI